MQVWYVWGMFVEFIEQVVGLLQVVSVECGVGFCFECCEGVVVWCGK